uniref:CCHC-type domain-containing protein n=2 Tax=Peronospora matthiolae TaxID=2874970 RepID=A0AAV1V7Y5_9STRA
MFNPAKFSGVEIARLRAVCASPQAPAGQHQVRKGTDDEWKIVLGLIEGTIACRNMPAFLPHILRSEECLRLVSTIQAQVEGELIMQLGRSGGVRVTRQSTKAITERILESAELARVNLPALHNMLGQTKTISYDQVTKSIHFYFFTRETAEKHKEVRVPFSGGVYRLLNAHRAAAGPIWDRQRGLNGQPQGRRVEYTILLLNVTRFVDIGRIAAFLKEKILTEFVMEDLDTHTPDSRTSTIWRVTFKLAGCPTFLDGIVRLLWFGTTIIVKPPNVGRRLQCLQCGNLGHTLARCTFTDLQLRGPGGVVVMEEDVKGLEDLARPFLSFEEIKEMAGRRLALQEAAEELAQAAVSPPARGQISGTQAAISLPEVTSPSSAPQAEQGEKFAHMQPDPRPAAPQPWITKQSKKGRSRGSSIAATGQVKAVASKVRTGGQELIGEDGEDWAEETKTSSDASEEIRVLHSRSAGALNPTVGLSDGAGTHSLLTSSEKARKQRGAGRGSAPSTTGPVLMTLKRNERGSFRQLVADLGRLPKALTTVRARATDVPTDVAELTSQLVIYPVITPATTNCLAMAIAQAATDASLDGPDRHLELLTACLKRGIKLSGLLDLEDQYAHDHRVHADAG